MIEKFQENARLAAWSVTGGMPGWQIALIAAAAALLAAALAVTVDRRGAARRRMTASWQDRKTAGVGQ